MISIEVCVGIEAFCHNLYSGYEICVYCILLLSTAIAVLSLSYAQYTF